MKNRSRTEYSMLNIFVGLGGYTINTIISFLNRMVFVRCLSESYLGLSALLTNFLGMLSLAELGIGSAIIYALYQPIAENDTKKIASLMRVYRIAYNSVGVIVAVAGLAAMPFLKNIAGDTSGIQENLYYIYLVYLFNTASSYFFSYRSSLLTAYQRNYIVLAINYAVVIVQNTIQIILLICLRSFAVYLLVLTVGTQLYNALITIWTNKCYPFINSKNIDPLSKEEKHKLLRNVKSVTVYKLSGTLVNNTDNIVITYFSGLGITGLASNYALLVNTLDSLIKQVFNSITASVGNLNAEADIEHQYSFFKALNLANFWLYGWASLGVAFVSGDMVALFFGGKYVMEAAIPVMLAINMYMVGMQNAVWTYKNTKGMFKYGQYLLLVTAGLNIIGDIVLGTLWGVFGIYLATAIARALTNAWYEPYALYRVAFHKSPLIYFKRYIRFALILMTTGFLCAILCSPLHMIPILNIIAKIGICTVVPFLVFYGCFRREPEFTYIKEVAVTIVNMIVNRVTHRMKWR